MGSGSEKGNVKTALALLQKSAGATKEIRAKAQTMGGDKKTTYSGNEVKLARSMV